MLPDRADVSCEETPDTGDASSIRANCCARCYVENLRARSGKLGECRLFNMKCCKDGDVIQLPRRMILLSLHLDQVLEYERGLSAEINIHIHVRPQINGVACIACNIDMRKG